MRQNPSFVKRFWWLGIPVVGVLGYGGYRLFFKKTSLTPGGGVKIPSTPQQQLPTQQPGGQAGMLPVTQQGSLEREVYTGSGISVLEAPSFRNLDLKGKILGYNVRNTLLGNMGAIYQLQKQLDQQRVYAGLFNGQYTPATKNALEKVHIKNDTYGETDWRKTLANLGFTINEAIPYTADYDWSKTLAIDAFVGRYINDVGNGWRYWIPPPVASCYPDKVSAELLTGLQMTLQAAQFPSGLYLGTFNDDVKTALGNHYEMVKNQILDIKHPNSTSEMYFSPSTRPDVYAGSDHGQTRVLRAEWHWSIYSLGLDKVLRLGITPFAALKPPTQK